MRFLKGKFYDKSIVQRRIEMEILKILLTKLSSRKFLVAAGGIVSGILLIVNNEITEGTTLICTAVISYLAAEGFIDLETVKGDREKYDDE